MKIKILNTLICLFWAICLFLAGLVTFWAFDCFIPPVKYKYVNNEISNILYKPTYWYYTPAAKKTAKILLKEQQIDGGWLKYNAKIRKNKPSYWQFSTFDNDNTTTQIRFLAKMYNRTHKNKYREAVEKGINFLIESQYKNGGWPLVVHDKKTYRRYITYNDNALVNVLYLLRDIANEDEDFKFVNKSQVLEARKALYLGVNCVLKTQLQTNCKKSIWAQQYDENTLKPQTARDYEPIALSTRESVEIIKFLQSLNIENKEVQNSISDAIEWLKEADTTNIFCIRGINNWYYISSKRAPKAWNRYYDIQTGEPIFAEKFKILKNFKEISLKRKVKYEWFGYWPEEIL